MATAATAPIVKAEISKPGFTSLEPESRAFPTSQLSAQDSPFRVRAEFVEVGRVPSSRPERLLFGALNDPTLRLRKPIPLSLSIENSAVVLTWPEADEFGYGPTMGSAADDFGHTLRELYRRLYADDVQLGVDLQKVKQILGEYIEPRTK